MAASESRLSSSWGHAWKYSTVLSSFRSISNSNERDYALEVDGSMWDGGFRDQQQSKYIFGIILLWCQATYCKRWNIRGTLIFADFTQLPAIANSKTRKNISIICAYFHRFKSCVHLISLSCACVCVYMYGPPHWYYDIAIIFHLPKIFQLKKVGTVLDISILQVNNKTSLGKKTRFTCLHVSNESICFWCTELHYLVGLGKF